MGFFVAMQPTVNVEWNHKKSNALVTMLAVPRIGEILRWDSTDCDYPNWSYSAGTSFRVEAVVYSSNWLRPVQVVLSLL